MDQAQQQLKRLLPVTFKANLCRTRQCAQLRTQKKAFHLCPKSFAVTRSQGASLRVQGAPGVPSGASSSTDTVLVWFKSDLRVDDHPGLRQASKAASIIPVFCFDPELQTQLLRTPNGLEGLMGALQALKQQLTRLGTGLLVKIGRADEIIPQLAVEHGVCQIIAEEEVEYRWLQAMLAVSSRLPQGTELKLWKASIFSTEPYMDNFRTFQSQRGSPQEPLAPPEELADLPQTVLDSEAADTEPSSATWSQLLQAADAELLSPQIWEAAADFEEDWGLSRSPVVQQLASGGEPAALQTFREYLATSSVQAGSPIAEAVSQTETKATPLGSFPAIFAQAVALGTVSRRRVFWEAQQALAQGSVLQQLLARPRPARSAAAAAESADWHWHMARGDRLRDTKTGAAPRHWRWRGFLTDYFTADPEEFGAAPAAPDAPAFLLIHGFGAFAEQWRGQIRALAAAGHLVYAPTLPGYGRAEKPSIPYSQQLWVSFLRDFVVEVVRRPVVAAGNSIGGFLVASLAADYKPLVQGLVLINSAGLIRPKYKPEQNLTGNGNGAASALTIGSVAGPPAVLADAVSTALLFYLERTVASTLSRAYPVNPDMADAWLSGEIARAASDPGAQRVFRSVFYLPKPRALNYLVSTMYGGPCLILQGAKDPLQDAKGRAREMDRLCPNVQVTLVDGGHCPFDEQPEFCNTELLKFIRSVARTPAPPAELSLTGQ